MKSRIFDHIDLRVRDREVAQKFYVKLLPALGFTADKSGEEWGQFEAEKPQAKNEFLGFTADRQHSPNGTRIAFWAESREEVDKIAQVARDAGARNIEGPEVCEEYSPGYYAVFFEDPDGNKLEVCCRESAIAAE